MAFAFAVTETVLPSMETSESTSCPIRSVETAQTAMEQQALVYNYADIEADENFTVHRQMIKHMQHPVIGDIAYINSPIRFAESGLVEPKPAGYLGQFNEEVFGEYLGMSPEEVAELKKNGTI